LTVGDEFAGRKVVCPICQLTVPVPNPNPTAARSRLAPSPDGNGAPRAPVAVADDEGDLLRTLGSASLTVWYGLACHSARLMLYLLTVPAITVLLIPAVASLLEPEVLSVSLSLVALSIVFVQPVLGIAGCILCLKTPVEANGHRFLLASVSADLATLAAGAVLSLTEQLLAYSCPLPVFSWAFLMLFFRKVALYIDQEDPAHEALELVVKGVVFLLAGAFLFFLWWGWLEIRDKLIPDADQALEVGLYVLTITWLVVLIRLILSNLEYIASLRDLIRPQG
jgi:hypothetical protein